jgi:hypothetical protein
MNGVLPRKLETVRRIQIDPLEIELRICWKNPICLASGCNEFQAVSRSYATMSLAAHDLGYGKQFQGSRMSENLGTPLKLLQAV